MRLGEFPAPPRRTAFPNQPTLLQATSYTMKTRFCQLRWLSAPLGLAATIGAAQAGTPSAPAPAPEPSIWDISLNAGLSLTDGNSDTLGVYAGLDAERITDFDEIYLGGGFLYAEDGGSVTNETVNAYAQYNRLLSERAYLGLVGDFLYDDVAAVDYRVNAGPTLGYYLLKNDRTRLALEVGGGYAWEKVGGATDEYFTLRFAQRLTHQLTDTMSLFQSVSFVPEAGDFDNYSIDAQAGIETAMTDRLSLRVFAQNRYDSTPAAGLEKNDFGVFSTLSLALGAVDPLPAAGGAKGGAKGVVLPSGGSDWDLDLVAGFSLTDGNSDTLGVTADLLATRIDSEGEIYLGAGGAYGETGGVVNQERAYAFGQRNQLLSDVTYLGARADFLYDAVNLLDYRVTPSVLLGRYLIKDDSTQLAVEVGPSFTWEDQGGLTDEYFGVAFGQRFSHQINDRLSVFQSARLVLDTDDTDNWTVDAAAGLDVKVSDRLSLRTAVQNIYDNQPAAGLEENDLRVTTGLVISF